MLVAWGMLLSFALLLPFCQFLRLLSGRWDLVIDRSAGTLRLPQSQGRREELVVPLASITTVKLETIMTRTSKGGTGFNYAPVVCFNASNGQHQEERHVVWLNKKSAHALVEWLRKQLKGHSSAM